MCTYIYALFASIRACKWLVLGLVPFAMANVMTTTGINTLTATTMMMATKVVAGVVGHDGRHEGGNFDGDGLGGDQNGDEDGVAGVRYDDGGDNHADGGVDVGGDNARGDGGGAW